ncbi:MAG: gamma-glutamylcyclotransferase [Rhizobiales bacterium]|nr:gamma-glutamylcyclotransferase [Hyphomicrobiales bacterium]
MHRVFVYGTLKRGLRNHHFLDGARFVGEAHTLAGYCMLDGGFPVLRDIGDGAKQIAGEVYDVDDETLSRLDDLESVDSGMYDRMQTGIVLSGNEAVQAFIYVGRGEYWDNKKRAPFTDTDRHGRLNWVAPDMRAK